MLVTTAGAPSAPPASQQDMHGPSSVMELVESQLPIPSTTTVAIDAFQRNADHMFTHAITGEELMDKLGAIFARYEIPVGLLHHLLVLSKAHVHFLIDDSGSMTNVDGKIAGKHYIVEHDASKPLSRWQEALNALLTSLRVMVFIPIAVIKITFLNRSDCLIFEPSKAASPDDLFQSMETKIRAVFSKTPSGGSPFAACLRSMCAAANEYARQHEGAGPYACYVYMDGCPSDWESDPIGNINRLLLDPTTRNPSRQPIAFYSCTGNDADVEWVKNLDEACMLQTGAYAGITETDDYETEAASVRATQGTGFPYSYGLYLIAHLVGAFFPDTLDALDESIPLTHRALSDIMGVELSLENYQFYWSRYLAASGRSAESHRYFSDKLSIFYQSDKKNVAQCIAAYRTETSRPPAYSN